MRVVLGLQVLKGGLLEEEDEVKMEAEQGIDGEHHDEGEDHARQDTPSRDDPSVVIRITLSEDEDPNALANDGQAVESDAAEQSDKTVVVLAADAVVEVLAVVVELLRAAVAVVAVVAGPVHVDAAFRADLQLLISHAWLSYAQQQVIGRIRAGEIEVVHEGEDEEDVGEREKDPEYG